MAGQGIYHMFFTTVSHTRLQAASIGRVMGVQQQGGVLRRPNVAELGMLRVCHVMLLPMEFWGNTSMWNILNLNLLPPGPHK